MFIISHAAHGYVSAAVLQKRLEKSNYTLFLWLCMVFAVFPDIDGVFSATVAGHHSILHTPIFWLIVSGIIWFGLKKQIIAGSIFLGSMMHLFTDWITARTVGIQWLYPFSGQNFYVYDIYPEQGQIPVFEMIVNPYWSFYLENKVLFGFELGLNFVALVFLIKNSNYIKMKGTS